MKELNIVLTELGISKVRLAKYLGVSRQMLYNYLGIDDINNWPKEKAAKLLSLLNIESIDDLKDLFTPEKTVNPDRAEELDLINPIIDKMPNIIEDYLKLPFDNVMNKYN